MKKKLSTVLVAAVTALAFMGTAAAQTPGKGKGPEAPGKGAKVKNYDFSGDDIEGEIVKPDGEDLNARKFAEHASLIRIRLDFIREIVKAAEDI
jgi:hypothetical protein